MGKIVALGGGDMVKQTGSINRRIVELTGRQRPRVLFIPTASRDNEQSWQAFAKAFGRLGCRCDVLWTMRQRPSRAEVRRLIGRADAIFVGGGNTLMMMRRWAFLGVDKELRTAYRRGVVLAGGSAGSICWFQRGHSDSMRGYGHDPWEYIAVTGLGFLRGIHCPHYHHKDRRVKFRQMIRQRGGAGLAIDDRCALEVVDGQFRVISSARGAAAYAVCRRRGQVRETKIPPSRQYRPLEELYALMAGFTAFSPSSSGPARFRGAGTPAR